MNDDVAEIDQQPASFSNALGSGVNLILGPHFTGNRISQRPYHSFARSSTNNKVVCKINLIAYVHQDDVFSLMLLEHLNNFSGSCNRVQCSLLCKNELFL